MSCRVFIADDKDGVRDITPPPPQPPRLHFRGLTRREREILKLLAESKSVKEIATTFDLSVKTVEAHKYNLMRKLGIHKKAQLVQHYEELGADFLIRT